MCEHDPIQQLQPPTELAKLAINTTLFGHSVIIIQVSQIPHHANECHDIQRVPLHGMGVEETGMEFYGSLHFGRLGTRVEEGSQMYLEGRSARRDRNRVKWVCCHWHQLRQHGLRI